MLSYTVLFAESAAVRSRRIVAEARCLRIVLVQDPPKLVKRLGRDFGRSGLGHESSCGHKRREFEGVSSRTQNTWPRPLELHAQPFDAR
ncbi:hypothetical protein Q5762_16950 [Streptomyces sp. P9(2023)]|uniref:hypothetical protein n=1 Tax=Streptomyces sp. P9(2023) TaxID=3064394 RepID=UPI0028F435CC|nr:hypothetical protein [Streptomyces sp. P9(2023)]MDT9690000.1 hypothetical protein [Streptomyces sp. P9(2023)]